MKMVALTSILTGKTFEGFAICKFPNKFCSFTVDEQIKIGLGIGGKLPVDWLPNSYRRARRQDRRKNRKKITA